MTSCTFFIKPSDNPCNSEEIKDKLTKGTMQQKCKGLKDLVKSIVNDENYPPLIMHIISTVIPIQHQSPQLRKIMLLYWQVIEKCKSANDKNLKEEIFLACNSLRNDLLCHNEYLRGRTLRLISRIMHRGVIEPLASAISSNLNHKSSYVRRNAVVCLYNVYINFGSDIIGDIDDEVEQLLLKETDLSTKRNAFLLLYKTNTQKALKYLQQQINYQAVEEIGDILQLAILKILKQRCKEDSTQKPKLLKIVNDFAAKASESVKLQCAITSTSISNSAATIKSSLYAYVNILTKTNELNVKKIILDKLELICKNSNYLQEDLIQDLVKGLETPSVDIKIKILHIIITGVTLKTSNYLLKQMQNEITQVKDYPDYLIELIKIIEIITFSFPTQHQQILNFILNQIFKLQTIPTEALNSTDNILKKILIEADKKNNTEPKTKILNTFDQIRSKELIKNVLNILGSYYNKEIQIEKVINKLKITIGSLPICVAAKQENDLMSKKEDKQVEERKVFKTVILEDGSYSTELVVEKNLQDSKQNLSLQENFSFRNFIAQDSIIGGIFGRNMSRLLFKIRKAESFNRHACSILMILCSMIRYYEENIFGVDQAIVQEISLLIRKIVNPVEFMKSENNELFLTKIEPPKQPKVQNSTQLQMIEKNPEDMINFRLLKKGGQQFDNFDFDDDEVNDLTNEQVQKIDYVSKLKSLVQLTGAFDPLYSEAFVTVNKYDIFFEILLINTSKSNLLNIQVEFSSPASILILEKAQSVNLRSKQSVMLRTHLRFSGSEFGVIYGYINFDNHAGLEQPYLITEEINIDYMQFIRPAKILQKDFNSLWQRITNPEVSLESNLPSKLSFGSIIDFIERKMHVKSVQNLKENQEEEEYFLNCQLYGKSKLGEGLLINVALFRGEDINSTITIRSKEQAVQEIIHKELVKCNFNELLEELQEEDEEEEQKNQQAEESLV